MTEDATAAAAIAAALTAVNLSVDGLRSDVRAMRVESGEEHRAVREDMATLRTELHTELVAVKDDVADLETADQAQASRQQTCTEARALLFTTIGAVGVLVGALVGLAQLGAL